jgi:hypothetical protein
MRKRIFSPRLLRVLAFGVCIFAGAAAIGARCIERTHAYVDTDGYTHITGEMDNDTDVQGTHIMLRGVLIDDQGNVVAQKDAAPCPPDTQPHSQIAFDIRFDNPNVPPWTKFDVRPISGIALRGPLPSPEVVVFKEDAIRFSAPPPIPGIHLTEKDVLLEFDVRNQGTATFQGVQGCAAVYEQSGKVTFVSTEEFTETGPDGFPRPATLDARGGAQVFMVAKGVPVGPTQVRVWLWFGNKGDTTSPYQFISSDMITIRTIQVP